MLSSVTRSPYICLQCRTLLLRTCRLQKLTRRPLVAPLIRHLTTYSPSVPKFEQIRSPQPINQSDEKIDMSIGNILSASAQRLTRGGGTPSPTRPEGKSHTSGITWASTGLRPVVVETMLRAFPNASRSTHFQCSLLQTLTNGTSVIAHGSPGTGKSFAIAIWLLALQRAVRIGGPASHGKPSLTTTALIIVPNIDLGKQYHMQITRLLEATESQAIMANPAAFVQVLYRGEDNEQQMELLTKHPNPHLLIVTPAALLDILSNKDPSVRSLVDYNSLKAIVIEEPDHALSRYGNPIEGETTVVEDETSKDSLLILLDYVFESRKVASVKGNRKPTQPQLVIPTSATGPGRLSRIIKAYHPAWIDGEMRPGFTPFTGKGSRSPSSNIICITESKEAGQYPRRVQDNITHHIVAYDPTTGFMRDAPVPKYPDADAVNAELAWSHEQEEKLEKKLTAALSANATEDELNALIQAYGNLAPEIKRRGYPPSVGAEALEILLTHDHWPKNVIVTVGDEASRMVFCQACADRGIRAQIFDTNTWNHNARIEGRLPIGRTDELISRPVVPHVTDNKLDTTVWVTNYYGVRGIDLPDVQHMYIMHRIDRIRDYITYAGRVGRWPFSAEDMQRDPRMLGRDVRPRAKVVSVVLEEHSAGGAAQGADRERGYALMLADGSEAEELVWKNEALRLAKMGLTAEKYFNETVTPMQRGGGNDKYGELGEVLKNQEIPALGQEAEKQMKVEENIKQMKKTEEQLEDKDTKEIEEKGIESKSNEKL